MGTAQHRRKIRSSKGGSKLSKRQHKRRNPVVRDLVPVKNPIVNKHWAKDKTLKANFEGLGLVLDPNASAVEKAKLAVELPEEAVQEVLAPAPVEAETDLVKELKAAADEGEARKRKVYSSRGDMMFVHRLVEKYGDDYEKMARDIKINTHQHTAAQLRRKVKHYYATLSLL